MIRLEDLRRLPVADVELVVDSRLPDERQDLRQHRSLAMVTTGPRPVARQVGRVLVAGAVGNCLETLS